MIRFLPCRKYRRWIFASLDQELAPKIEARLQRHLQGCANCRSFRHLAEKQHRLLLQAFTESPPLPGSLVEPVLMKVGASPPKASPSRRRMLLTLAPIGLLGVLILSGIFQRLFPPTLPTVRSVAPLRSPSSLASNLTGQLTQRVERRADLLAKASPSPFIGKGVKKAQLSPQKRWKNKGISPQRLLSHHLPQQGVPLQSIQKQEATTSNKPLVKTDDHQRIALSLGDGLRVRLNIYSEITPVRAPQPEDPYWEIRLVRGEMWFQNLAPQQGLRILTPAGEAVIPPGEIAEASVTVDRDTLSEINLIVVRGRASFQSPQGIALIPEMSSVSVRVGEAPEVARFLPDAPERVQWAYEPVQQNLTLR